MRLHPVPVAGLAFVIAAPVLLTTIVARGPDTHGHLWHSLPAGYDRTPVEAIGEADLQQIMSELPAFTFPAPGMPGPGGASAAAGPAQRGGTDAAGSTTSAAAATAQAQRITLTESEFAITPDRLTAKAGVPVELTVTNEGKQVHGLWMADFGIMEDIRAGKTQVFRFTPSKPGRYRYVCSYSLCGTDAEHARMVGFLTVE